METARYYLKNNNSNKLIVQRRFQNSMESTWSNIESGQ